MPIEPGLLIVIFIIGGITLKLADVSGEEGNNILQYVSAIIAALSFGLLISDSSTSSSIILGIIVGVSVSKKVNRPNLVLGLVLTLLIASALGFKSPVLPLLVTVSLLVIMDEICHDKFKDKKSILTNFFHIRPLLKLTMILLAIASLVDAIYAVGFLSFDFAYDTTDWLINKHNKQKQG